MPTGVYKPKQKQDTKTDVTKNLEQDFVVVSSDECKSKNRSDTTYNGNRNRRGRYNPERKQGYQGRRNFKKNPRGATNNSQFQENISSDDDGIDDQETGAKGQVQAQDGREKRKNELLKQTVLAVAEQAGRPQSRDESINKLKTFFEKLFTS